MAKRKTAFGKFFRNVERAAGRVGRAAEAPIRAANQGLFKPIEIALIRTPVGLMKHLAYKAGVPDGVKQAIKNVLLKALKKGVEFEYNLNENELRLRQFVGARPEDVHRALNVVNNFLQRDHEHDNAPRPGA